ncbi:MAG TPA: HEAT repeat domain-containing protein, partial [Candidatus Binataceae bacterium]|nr:HEAT repeat domain-containing protein [Candidatus Binataceae bacterium]
MIAVLVFCAAPPPAGAQSVKQARREAAAQAADAPSTKSSTVKKTSLRYGGKSFNEWRELFLTDVEPATRIKALPALVKLGRYGYSREAAETIVTVLEDDDRELLEAAIHSLTELGPGSVPTIVEVCRSDNGTSRYAGLSALKCMGSGAAEAVPSLLDLLEATDGTKEDDGYFASEA